MKRLHAVLACVPFVLILAGCGEQPKPAVAEQKEPEKPAVPVAPQSAFNQMYVLARAWAPDAKIMRMADLDFPGVKSEGGKAAAWECMFVSEKKGRSKIYRYAVAKSSDGSFTKGATGSSEEPWGQSVKVIPFALMYYKTDAPAAYELAVKKSADYIKKNPDMPVHFVLEYAKRFPAPTWRVIWGESATKSNYSVYINAYTGQFDKIER